MSKLNIYTRQEPTPIKEVNNATPFISTSQVLIEAVPVPVGTNEYDPNLARRQGRELTAFRKMAKDMMEPNDCRLVTSAGERLYQTMEKYGTGMSVEQMTQTMETEGITMRVNFRRPGVHSSTTCMELSSKHLNNLLKETQDAKNQKTLELRVKAEASVAVPRHGAMFVTVEKKGAVHMLSHIDYKIMTSYDEMFHTN